MQNASQLREARMQYASETLTIRKPMIDKQRLNDV
jgi:hypothetical protein